MTDRMIEVARTADLGRSIVLTYNGRQCELTGVRFHEIVEGKPQTLRITVEALLPRGWDQGPPQVTAEPPAEFQFNQLTMTPPRRPMPDDRTHPATLAMGFAIFAGLLCWRGLALASLWHWFMVPIGMPAIGIAHAIGFTLIGVATMGGLFPRGDEKIDVSRAIVAPCVLLAVGWCVKAFV